jgi:uncharacterized protein (DUF58 family)
VNAVVTAETRARPPSVFTISLTLYLVGLGLFVALLTRQSSLALLCILVFSMVAGAKAWSLASLSRLRSELRVDRQRAFPGETIVLSADVENAKLLPVWLQVSVSLDASVRSLKGARRLARDSGLSSFQRVTFDWQLEALRRGVHRLGPSELEASDPLGFFPRTARAAAIELIVYPRLVPMKPTPLPRRDFFGKPSANSPIEDPTFVHGTRDYQPGRAARYIHWKASARQGRLVEKMCEPAAQERTLIALRAEGFAEEPTGEALERCLEVAASLAVQLDRLRYSVGLATNARLRGGGRATLELSRRPGQLSDLLEIMARIEPVQTSEMLDVLTYGSALSSTLTVVCFSYARDAASDTLCEFIHQRRLALVHVVCRAEDGDETVQRLEDLRADAP